MLVYCEIHGRSMCRRLWRVSQ